MKRIQNYIGKKQNNFEIHNNTNNILNKINQYSKHVSRKNKGSQFIQLSKNQPLNINKVKYNTMKSRRRTYKSKKQPHQGQPNYNNSNQPYNVTNFI